jgi:hypothetical protein
MPGAVVIGTRVCAVSAEPFWIHGGHFGSQESVLEPRVLEIHHLSLIGGCPVTAGGQQALRKAVLIRLDEMAGHNSLARRLVGGALWGL